MKRFSRSVLSAVVLAVACVSMAGCFDRKETVAINPDGSGRATITIVVPPAPEVTMGGGKPTAKQNEIMARKGVEDLVAGTAGVDAWKDLSFEVLKDGSISVKGVAYFPKVSEFKTEMGPKLKWEKSGEGEYTLSYVLQKKEGGQVEPPKLSDEEVAARILKERESFKQQIEFMKPALEPLKMESIFVLPGSIKEVNILQKKSGNTASLTIEGKKLIEAMEKAMADDKKLGEQIRSGKKAGDDPEVMTEALFGKRGGISVTVTGVNKPVFDYAKEMEAAKAGQEALFKKLEISPRRSGVMEIPVDGAGN